MKASFYALLAAGVSLLAMLLGILPAQADDADVLAIQGNVSRQLFGSGTGVVVGIVDSGVASSHPALAGNDSQGNPRLVAAANFVNDGDTSATDNSVEGHGTLVTSAILSNDPVHTGMAPDARYVNARVLNVNDQFGTSDAPESAVINGIGYAVSQNVNVMNISLNWGPGVATNGSDGIDLILDWAVQQGINITVSAGNIAAHRNAAGDVVFDESPLAPVTSPGSAYNVVTVGRTGAAPGDQLGPVDSNTVYNYNQVHIDSRSGQWTFPNAPLMRDKPDLVAPGTNITLANNDFVPGDPSTYWTAGLNGTSISAPLVAGMMAQQIGYGQTHGLSTNPLVIKATMMTSADQVLNKDGSAWQPYASSVVNGVLQVTSPLDTDSGAGQVDGARLYQQYTAGKQGPGSVNSIGWDLHDISGVTSTTYSINTPQVAGSQISVSLDWLRHIDWVDSDHNGVADSGDSFTSHTLDQLNLSVLVNGNLVAESMSAIDNEQFLNFLLPQSGTVSLEIDELNVAGAPMAETYGLAWNVSAVPEPCAIVLAACGAIFLGRFRRLRRPVAPVS